MKRITIFAIGLVCGIAVSVGLISIWSFKRTEKIHVLMEPMIISSNVDGNVSHLLPAGTTLHFDKSYAEGFTRYRVYVNVDRMPLSLRDLNDPNEINPLEARAFDKSALAQALRDCLLTRQEIAATLQFQKLTKQDIREIFADHLQSDK